ncbi:putative cytosine-specific DNA methylotransferase [[Clostridium] sordellii]|uniref:DNA cytosine methyltransferase n=1 Tax=Paraclostridium sordellii TaxID=1505 RepID=UPI0005E9803C|nr:DNA cytosine methyltransferase [Paeniclostridium sordellii]CEP39622.1 putative cytosine-specific DNA methylotransferase [[Clostridium] sordellii] [Paeniclostridium sordellii]
MTFKIKQATKKGYDIANDGDSVNLEQPNSKTRRGRVGKKIANTLTTSCNQGVVTNLKIRKLTPLECWRLMGFTDEDFFKAKKTGISDRQLYKLAGNSIVVAVLEGIFKELLIEVVLDELKAS